MSGGKGGSSTSSVEIPEYIEAAAQRNLNKAERISQLGYVPQYGPSVAAFTPMQQAGFQNTASAAGAFGLAAPTTQQDIMGGMPAPTTYAGGVQGYSSTPLYEQMVAELAAQRPAQKSYIDSFFIDPVTGQYSASAMPAVDYTQMGTLAEAQREREAADRANELAIAQAQAQAGPQTMITNNNALTPTEYQQAANTVAGPDYNPATDILTDEQRNVVMSDTQEGTDARIAQEDLAMGVIGDANNNIIDDIRTSPVGDALNIEPSFEDPLSSGSYGGSLVTGRPSDSSQALFDNLNQGSNFDDGGGSTLAPETSPRPPVRPETPPVVVPPVVAPPAIPADEGSGSTLAPTTSPRPPERPEAPTEPAVYTGDAAKNKAVADILSETYGWSDQKLASLGYEGYAPTAPEIVAPPAVPADEGGGSTLAPTTSPRPPVRPETPAVVAPPPVVPPVVAPPPVVPPVVAPPAVPADEGGGSILAPTTSPRPPERPSAPALSGDAVPAVNPYTGAPNLMGFPMSFFDEMNAISQTTPETPVAPATNIPADNTEPSSLAPTTSPRPPTRPDRDGDNGSNLAPTTSPRPPSRPDSDGGNEGNGGCVVATHAVNAGAFTPSMKREAVVWCMHNLHDKWWGEAVRRGYRHLGNKKIAQGKAREHYEEFRRYVDFASGKKRTIKGALTFTLRTAQFFAVGLVKKDA